MSEQTVYTDVEGRRWVLDPNGTHGWTSPDPGRLSRSLGPFRPWRRLSGLSLPDGEQLDNGTLRYYSIAPSEAAAPESPASAPETPVASAIPPGDHRAALERIVYALTGADPDPRVIDLLLAAGARAYWVAPPR